jgi:hypothetical protein
VKKAAPALLALVAACDIAGDCLPAALSSERESFRQQLGELVYVSQCHGPPTPPVLIERERGLDVRKGELLGRISRSKLGPDLAEAEREFQEYTRNANEADCATYPDDYGAEPEDVAEFAARLDGEEKRLKAAEAQFERLNGPCIG